MELKWASTRKHGCGEHDTVKISCYLFQFQKSFTFMHQPLTRLATLRNTQSVTACNLIDIGWTISQKVAGPGV